MGLLANICRRVSVYVTNRYFIDTLGPIQLVFGTETYLVYSTLCYKGIGYLQKVYFPLELCPKLWT